jgi:hypothetical protein
MQAGQTPFGYANSTFIASFYNHPWQPRLPPNGKHVQGSSHASRASTPVKARAQPSASPPALIHLLTASMLLLVHHTLIV